MPLNVAVNAWYLPDFDGPCSILGYFSSWGPLLVGGSGASCPPLPPPPLGGPGESSRVTVVLSTVSRYQVRVRHIAGIENLPSDVALAETHDSA